MEAIILSIKQMGKKGPVARVKVICEDGHAALARIPIDENTTEESFKAELKAFGKKKFGEINELKDLSVINEPKLDIIKTTLEAQIGEKLSLD